MPQKTQQIEEFISKETDFQNTKRTLKINYIEILKETNEGIASMKQRTE